MQEIERNEKLEERDKRLPPDTLGLLVQDLYREAASDRRIHEEIWDSAWHAWRGEFKDVTTKAVQLAKERGIYVNLTRRKVQEARVKLTNSILQNAIADSAAHFLLRIMMLNGVCRLLSWQPLVRVR